MLYPTFDFKFSETTKSTAEHGELLLERVILSAITALSSFCHISQNLSNHLAFDWLRSKDARIIAYQ